VLQIRAVCNEIQIHTACNQIHMICTICVVHIHTMNSMYNADVFNVHMYNTDTYDIHYV